MVFSAEQKIIKTKSIADAYNVRIKFSKYFSLSSEQCSQFHLMLAMQLMEKAWLYRRLRAGNIQLSLSAFDKAETWINELKSTFGENSAAILALEGWLDTGRGTVQYRQHSYEELPEFYLQGELKDARYLFERQSQGNPFEGKGILLLDGKNKLEKARNLWDTDQEKKGAAEEELRNKAGRWLAETYYRIGEFQWLRENFDGEEGALAYLKRSIDVCNEVECIYLKLDAMESYVTSCYFCKTYNDDFDNVCISYIQETEKHRKKYPLILAKLRITQGDEIFSRIFEISNNDKCERYRGMHYILRKNTDKKAQSAGTLPDTVKKQIRTMVSYYIEACSLMQKTEVPRNFAIAVRVITRRFKMISDVLAQECAHEILQDTWNEYENLQSSQNELKNISEFSRILNGFAK